ncbi:helix-turn-helix domain-containing protein [Microbispora bryophytorum]|uniref:helix-turn-helix domain-containing protein n=1 Tax=Microbispora bryophytorum TaxID=1460882 RepID=UPI0033D8768A
MNDRELGQRVAYWRRRRGLTQQILADRLGRSISWLRKVEAGVRSADRLSVLDSLCEALNVDLQTLIGEEPARSGTVCIDDAQVEQIRNAMELYTSLLALPDDRASRGQGDCLPGRAGVGDRR